MFRSNQTVLYCVWPVNLHCFPEKIEDNRDIKHDGFVNNVGIGIW